MSTASDVNTGQKLTDREVSLLKALADGQDRTHIAATLGIAPLTVKSHLHRIYAKLGARNSAHAVMLAMTAGYFK